MRKDVIPRFIIWLIIQVATIVAVVLAVLQDGRLGFGFLLPVLAFIALPDIFTDKKPDK